MNRLLPRRITARSAVMGLSASGLTFKLNVRLITDMSRAATKSGRKTARRRPGRPEGAAHRETVRADLLQAARELFAKRDFTAASVREIAAAARVNPAMIHYHFG